MKEMEEEELEGKKKKEKEAIAVVVVTWSSSASSFDSSTGFYVLLPSTILSFPLFFVLADSRTLF